MNPVESGEAQIELDMTLQGQSLLAGPADVALDGPFALGRRAACRASTSPSTPRSPASESTAPWSPPATTPSSSSSARTTASEPTAWLRSRRGWPPPAGWRAASASTSRAGSRTRPTPGRRKSGGAETERIEGTLRSEAVAKDLTALAGAVGAPGLVRGLAAGVESGPVEASVAFDDDTIRRLRAQFPFTVPVAQRASTSGITGGVVDLRAEVSDVGSEVEIEPPSGGGFQPIEDLIGRLRDLASLGGL